MRYIIALLLTVSVANAATLAGITNVYGIYPRGGIPIPSVVDLETELANRPTSPDVLNILAAATAGAATTNYVEEYVTNYVGTNIPAGVITNGQDITTTIPGLTNIAIAAVDGLADFVSTNGSSGNAITNYDTREIILSNNFTVATGEPAWVGIYSNNVLIASIDGTNSFRGNGINLTNLAADQLTTGTVPTARLGSGTANAGTALFGDGTWKGVYTNGPNSALSGYGDDGAVQSVTPGSGLILTNGVLAVTNPSGSATFDVDVTWATSNDTETVVWDMSGDSGSFYRFGPIMVIGTGATNYISGTIQDAVFQRQDGGSTTFLGSNTTTWVRSDAGLEARMRKATGNAMELTVKGFANENMNWAIKGFAMSTDIASSNTPAPAADTLTNSLVAYWKLNESSSGTREDAHTNNYDLTQTGTVSPGTAKLGAYSATWNADTEYLTASDVDSLSALNNSITWVFWTQITNTTASRALVAKSSSSSAQEYRIAASSTSFSLAVYTNSSSSALTATASAGTIDTATWYFVCATIDVTNKYPKIRIGSGTTLGSWNTASAWGGYGPDGTGTNTTAPVRIGYYSASALHMRGFIDDVRVWNRELTEDEITALFNNGTGRED